MTNATMEDGNLTEFQFDWPDETKALEDLETQTIYITSPKRKDTILVSKESEASAFFKASYSTGNNVPGCEGSYTSRKGALTAVRNFLYSAKKSDAKKKQDIFGDEPKERPVLKRKKVHASDSNSKDSK